MFRSDLEAALISIDLGSSLHKALLFIVSALPTIGYCQQSPQRVGDFVGIAVGSLSSLHPSVSMTLQCLGRWGTDSSNPTATAPLAAAALRATVALSGTAGPLAAVLRVRLLAALASTLARGVAVARIQVSAAAFLAGLSSYGALRKHMFASGRANQPGSYPCGKESDVHM